MEYTEGRTGRVFVVRFDHGEDFQAVLKRFCKEKHITAGHIHCIGAVRRSRVVVGPKETTIPPDPLWKEFDDAREVLGIGTIATSNGEPSIHMHSVFSREEHAFIGCVRGSAEVYLVIEAIITELCGITLERIPQHELGISLLQPRAQDESRRMP